MKIDIKKAIFEIVLTIICLILCTTVSKADWAPDEIVFDSSEGIFTAPFTGKAFTDGITTYCRAHGFHISNVGGKITYKALYEKEQDGDDADTRKITIGTRLAYAFIKAEDDNERQDIIWYLNAEHRNDIYNRTNIKFRILNTGSKTIDNMPNALNKAINYSPPSNPNVSIDVRNAKVKTVIIDNVKYFKISNFSVDWSGLGDDGNVKLSVGGINHLYANDSTGLHDYGSAKNLTNKGNKTIYLKYDEAKGLKDVNINVVAGYTQYSGEIAKYKYDSTTSTTDVVESKVQTMLRLHTNVDTKYVRDSGNVKLVRPRLITTKYIKEITSASGEQLYRVPDSWNPNAWDRSKLKPIVTVNVDKDVDASDRYSLTEQNARGFNISYGDVIKYSIRVYNVGNDTADLSDTSLKSTNYDGEHKIIENGYLYDYPDSHLEHVNNGKKWISDSSAYKIKLTELGDEITSYEEAKEKGQEGDVENWSKYMTITFKVKQGNESQYTIKNNGNTSARDDKTLKFLKSATTKDKDGNDVNTTFQDPKVKVYPNRDVTDENRMVIDMNAPNLTVMDGDTLTYCIRYYSIGLNDTQLNYKVTDTFGVGLEFESATTQDNESIEIQKSGDKLTISPPKKGGKPIILDGIKGKSTVTNVPHYDIYLKFKVKTSTEYVMNKTNKLYVPLLENKVKNTVNVPVGFEIKGKVFIDNLDASGKVTKDRNAEYDSSDKIVEGIKVELLEEDGVTPAKIKNPATGEEYPNVVYTNDKGEYKFNYLRVSKINIIKEDGSVDGNIKNLNKYCVRFTYNGQEYENVKYANNNSKEASYATEFESEKYGALGRGDFNNQFTTIDKYNSGTYSLMKEENKVPQVTGYTNVSPAAMEEFKINSYSGNNNNRTVSANTKYKDYLNLGLVKREFDLNLENRLDSMNISINGVEQQIKSINGGIITENLADQDIHFQEADYNAIAANGNSPIGNDATKELSVWVNYTITVRNESTDNFIGILKKLNFYCDGRFDALRINGKDMYNNINRTDREFIGTIEIPVEEKEIDNSADNGKQEIKISLHLTRDTIQKVIDADENQTFKTLETVAEIGSYSTKYGGDIFGNGHGTGNPNAGKVDEDSNAANFDLEKYVKDIRKSTDPKEILQFFNKEDDCKRSLGIKLKKNTEQRKLTGIVFEDATEHNSQTNQRLGNGKYEANAKDKTIDGVTVNITENDNAMKVYNKDSRTWEEVKVLETKNGKYSIEGFIPSKDYQVKFTYGDEKTDIYNAQDYKSTIDTTNEKYEQPKEDNGYSPEGAENYWYSKQSVNNKSVAKDIYTKMDSAITLTNEEALKLEDYKTLGINKTYVNEAITPKIYVPIRKDGNKNSNDEQYTVENINLGLAERPRSELTINKVIDHINITTSDGRVLIDGNQGTANSTSWLDRYVQAIVDENLIYGSTLQVTFKYFITNTGEVDYKSTGNVEYNENGIIANSDREYYDYGTINGRQEIVTNKPKEIIDFADNGMKYNPDGIANPENDAETKNSTYWRDADNTDKSKLNDDTKAFYDNVSVRLIAKKDFKALTPGETYGKQSGQELYLTLSKVLSTETDKDGDSLEYNNIAEILEQTNSVGRRSYHTTTEPNKGQHSNSNYTTESETDQNGRIIGYKISSANNRGNGQNILLSDVGNRLNAGDKKINMNSTNNNYLVLTIPGDVGDPKNEAQTTLYWEPDADEGSIVIIPPFGNQKIIWIALGTTVAIILAGGIYLIKKKVL